MKKLIVIILLGTIAFPGFLPAQTLPRQSVPTLPPRSVPLEAQPTPQPTPQLTRFDMDFPGGSPGDLVKVIEMATHKPLNAIVSEEYAEFHIPALKMRAVTVPELFTALTSASQKKVNVVTGTYFGGLNSVPSQQFQSETDSYGFKTDGVPREDSIWYFYHSGHPAPPGESKQKAVICRFFQLAPFLETYKVEDITTAIDTGWRMLGEETLPKVSFHKDTKLLVAVGDPEKLKLIDSVLEKLTYKTPTEKPTVEKAPAPAKSRDPAKP